MSPAKLSTIKELSMSPNFPYRESTIRKLIKEGKLKVIKLSPRKTMISDIESNRFLNDEY